MFSRWKMGSMGNQIAEVKR
jgi:hypothetical protein